MILKKAIVERSLLLAATGGRAQAEASLRKWSKEHPTKSCAHCFGFGSYVERAGERMRWQTNDFVCKQGDIFVGTCPVCNGLGRVFISLEEHEARLEEERAEYRKLRRAICSERNLSAQKVDELAKKRARRAELLPSEWLAAIKELAVDFGVEG